MFLRATNLAFLPFFLFGQSIVFSQEQSNTCDIDGQIFQRGENLGSSFVTRCGPYTDYPCFCNPDLSQLVECPYCGFALESGGLLCGKDGETHRFTDINGIDKTCSCSAPTGETPTENCNVANPNDDEGYTCTIALSDGSEQLFARGESLADYLPSVCGDDYPCFCDPSIEGQVYCPFCTFATFEGDFICAGAAQNVSFIDATGSNKHCTCIVNSNGDRVSSCVAINDDDNNNSSPTPAESDFCRLEVDGQMVTVANGESYGEYLTTRCGSSSDFPCYCDTSLPNQVYCPYCGFFDALGNIFCAKGGETIEFVDGDEYQTCSCEIPEDSSMEAIRTCSSGNIPPSIAPSSLTTGCAIEDSNGETVVIEDGESFGELVVGVCGSAFEWPSYCNVNSTSTTSRQVGYSIEYPYCIFEDTQSGDPVCARSNGQVTYVDSSGVSQQCTCTYLTPSLGGAQSQCREEPVSIPTSRPTVGTIRPTLAPVGGGSGSTLTVASWGAVFIIFAMLIHNGDW